MDTRPFKLSDDSIRALENVELASQDVEERRHLQAVRLYRMGEPLETIVRVVQATERTLRRWVARFTAGGVGGLAITVN